MSCLSVSRSLCFLLAHICSAWTYILYGLPQGNRNRNLKTSKALLKSQAHQGTSLFTSAATNQRGVKRSSGPNSRVPGGDRVPVRVGVVEMGRANDQKGQGRRD